MKLHLSLIAATLGLAAAAASAAPGAATERQINAIKAGQSQAEVLQTLGKPSYTPNWADGSHSLVYYVSDAHDHSTRAYIDVGRDNKVLDVQFGDDGEDN
ncbi:outer membrane protein assembly factor BamE [Uliginosibacterium paludis]|uniref:Outer membrane protein assembly factor BamE n=1 Tax=Uliginosibacterium paludis TaxID=1615952 RepID=A0ABV2CPK6_9RHOO